MSVDSARPDLSHNAGGAIMFARVAADPFKTGTPNGSKAFANAEITG